MGSCIKVGRSVWFVTIPLSLFILARETKYLNKINILYVPSHFFSLLWASISLKFEITLVATTKQITSSSYCTALTTIARTYFLFTVAAESTRDERSQGPQEAQGAPWWS